MKYYEASLQRQGRKVSYISASQNLSLQDIFQLLKNEGVTKVHYADVHDYLLQRRITRYAWKYGIHTVVYNTPSFICTNLDIENYFAERKRYFLNDFYIDLRKRLAILVEDDEPLGGKWSFDHENRKRLPAKAFVPNLPEAEEIELVLEARTYVDQIFPDTIGSAENFRYPVTRSVALAWLDSFVLERLHNYGAYQDAIVAKDSFLFHSVLTPALNIGLLTPDEVLERVIDFGKQNKIPINSIEGFVRQVLGWREFVRVVYTREGVRQRTENHFRHNRKIPRSFWTGETGIEPVDNVIRKALRNGYANHIERLMIIGNFMLLCEFDPDDVYQWFMEFYVDSYDWVMVPNVYGMSQFADGGLMSTKPYVSGSNYIVKMSDFKKGPWCEIWDALYWTFIEKHKTEFEKNPRMSMMVVQLTKMNSERLENLRKLKNKFLLDLMNK